MEFLFVFCIVWSFGAIIDISERPRFNKLIKEELNGIILPKYCLFDAYFNVKQMDHSKWDELLYDYIPPNDNLFSKILVPTTDTVKYKFLLETFNRNNSPLLFVGDQGTAKTVIIKNYLNQLNLEQNSVVTMNFSFRTNSLEV